MTEQMADFLENYLHFSNVLNSSITASWLVLAVILLRFLLKKAPKWIHVMFWGVVAIRLLFPFSIESAFSLIPSNETLPSEILSFEGNQLSEPVHIDVVTNPLFAENVTIELEQTIDKVQVKTMYMGYVWCAGMIIMLIYTVFCYVRLRCRVRTAVCLRDNIFQSERVGSPFVLGILRPRIYLPFQVEENDMWHVIAHEQTHILRKDHWWKPFGFMLLTIHWFNPLLWVAYILFCRDIELACDEKVIKNMGREQRADYSEALLSFSISTRRISAYPLAFGEIGVKTRVKNVLNHQKTTLGIVLVSLLACIVVGVCFLTNPVTVSATMQEEAPAGVEEADNESRGDSLVYSGELTTEEMYSAVFNLDLGDKIGGGSVRVEEWYHGECVRSGGGSVVTAEIHNANRFTQDTEELYLRIKVSTREAGDSEVATGAEVEVMSDKAGGTSKYDFLSSEYGEWRFVKLHEPGEELEPKLGEKRLLAVVEFGEGGSENIYDADTFLNHPEKLKSTGRLLVIWAAFSSVELYD